MEANSAVSALSSSYCTLLRIPPSQFQPSSLAPSSSTTFSSSSSPTRELQMSIRGCRLQEGGRVRGNFYHQGRKEFRREDETDESKNADSDMRLCYNTVGLVHKHKH